MRLGKSRRRYWNPQQRHTIARPTKKAASEKKQNLIKIPYVMCDKYSSDSVTVTKKKNRRDVRSCPIGPSPLYYLHFRTNGNMHSRRRMRPREAAGRSFVATKTGKHEKGRRNSSQKQKYSCRNRDNNFYFVSSITVVAVLHPKRKTDACVGLFSFVLSSFSFFQ